MSKPYDRLFKTLAEDDPRGLLHLFGSVPLEVEAEVRAVEREVAAPALEVDHVYHVQTAKEEWLEHYEVQTRYKSDVPERLVWYGVTLTLRSRLPVRTTLVLLAERYAPRRVRATGQVKMGCLEMISRYRVVRVWRLEAAMVLRQHGLQRFAHEPGSVVDGNANGYAGEVVRHREAAPGRYRGGPRPPLARHGSAQPGSAPRRTAVRVSPARHEPTTADCKCGCAAGAARPSPIAESGWPAQAGRGEVSRRPFLRPLLKSVPSVPSVDSIA